MKKLTLALTLLSSAFIFSCNDKDPGVTPTPEQPTDTAYSTRNLLSKTVTTLGTDVVTTMYQYDAQNKLAWVSNTSSQADYKEDTSRIVRNGQGIITQIVYSGDTTKRFPDPKLDSVVYDVFYNSTTQRYSHKILQYLSYKVKFKDSIAYAYNAQSKITREESYYFDFKVTKKYIIWAGTDYSYDAKGDMTNLKTTYYDIDYAGTNYPFESAYTYDDKENVFNLGNEAIVTGLQEGWSGHNILTMVGTYPKDPQYNQSFTYQYNYNSVNRPLSAAVTESVSGAKGTKVYTYQ